MEQLTTDNPTGCSDTMLNLAYAENSWVKIRGMEKDFLRYVEQQCRQHGCNLSEMSDDELCDAMFDCGFSNHECPVFLLYMVATQAAELRTRLKRYEDAEEQGHLVWLPCRVGDTVFSLWSRVDSKKQYIRSAIITVANLMYYLSRIQCGTTFTTRQDAEKALEATP